jgi:Methyltransferase domain
MAQNLKRLFYQLADLLLAPFLIPAALLMKLVRRLGVERLPLVSQLLLFIGVFPIRNHYYEPRFDYRVLDRPNVDPRQLPGIELNHADQTKMLNAFRWQEEFSLFCNAERNHGRFRVDNGMFEGADAAYYYNLIRLTKPNRVIEIGSGQSTIVAQAAITANRQEPGGQDCDLLCIEPYESPWLEATGAKVMRQRVEALDPSLFSALRSGDILFIDSSHVIRPQGDVVHLYLRILPSLSSGVIVHVHDIFTPRDYPDEWLAKRVWLWNEQYLLEGLLSGGTDWQVLGALNYFYHDALPDLDKACGNHASRSQPSSFYIVKK